MKLPLQTRVFTARNCPYPRIFEVPEPPTELHIQGTEKGFELLSRIPDYGFAIVGTREPSARCAGKLRSWIRMLNPEPLVIVSGMARGIDCIAHEEALARGIPTIGVLGTGFNIQYPLDTLELRSRIFEKGGLLVTEHKPDSRPKPFQFLHRNRLIAGWSKATLVVEAGARSGAINTGTWALKCNSKLFTVPSFPDDPDMIGNQYLVEDHHAAPFLGPHSLGEVWLEMAGIPRVLDEIRRNKFRSSNLLIRCVRRLTLDKGGASVEDLTAWALEHKWASRDFFNALHQATLRGEIQQERGRWISI